MPIPLEIENSEDKDIPLTSRKSGIDIYWNERLIKEAHLPLLNRYAHAYCVILLKIVLDSQEKARLKRKI